MDDEPNVGGDQQDGDAADSKQHPETVPWSQYVGLKEKFTRVEGELKGKVQGLEEQLKQAVNPEEFQKVQKELDEAKGKLDSTSTELETIKGQALTEKREFLVKKGVKEEKIKEASVKELDILIDAIGGFKPSPDLGSGGGSGSLQGVSPMELARRAYEKK